MEKYYIEAGTETGTIEVEVTYDEVTDRYVVDYVELLGTEGRYIVPTRDAVKEVLRDLAQGREIYPEIVGDYVRELDSFTYTPLGNWEAKDGDYSFFEWGGEVSVHKGNEEIMVVSENTAMTEVWKGIK